MNEEYAQHLAALKPKLQIEPILIGGIGGSMLFSTAVLLSYHCCNWAVTLFGGMLGGLVGLQVAIADKRKDMRSWEWLKQMVKTLEKMPSQEDAVQQKKNDELR